MRMRLSTSKLLRRSRPPPLPLYFVCHCFSSSSSSSSPSYSYSLLSSSPYQHHQQYNNRSSPAHLSLLPHNRLSFTRRFSTQLNFSESDELLFPVQAIISVLDSYHDLTGFPWWIIISSSTVAMRLVLFPLIVVQLKKLKRIAELMPKLPPPPLSG